MSNRVSIIFSVLLIFFLVSCATTSKTRTNAERQVLLDRELQNWQTFKITGMVEGRVGIFSGRFNTVIAKTTDKMRIDVMSGGVFGIGGGVLFAGYIDGEQFQYRLPGNQDIEVKDLDGDMRLLYQIFSEQLLNHIERNKARIVETLRHEFLGFQVSFTESMKIREILGVKDNIQMEFIYDRQDNLQEIKASIPQIRNVTIHIDKVEYDNVSVRPLR